MFQIIAILAVIACAAAFKTNAVPASFNASKVNPSVPALNVEQYLGYWYQMYADAYVIASFEKDTYCATATYGLRTDGSLSVLNYATTGSPTGAPYTIDGYAYIPDTTKPGQLKVHFDSSDAFPFDAPYWVLALGPVVNNQYDWAIVSDNFSAFLFVLARDVSTYRAKYDAEVQETLKGMGFTGLTKPVVTYHEADCVYKQ